MENIVSTEQMNSLKALSDVNIKISEAQNLLFSLQEQETEYLIIREAKAKERIQKVLDDSEEMVRQADKNHTQVKELLTGLSDFVQNLIKIQADSEQLLTGIEERNILWEKDIKQQQDEIAEIHRQQKAQNIQILNDQSSLDSVKKRLAEGQRKLDSDTGTLQRTIERLKNNKI